MAFTTKTLRDGAGGSFTGAFFEDVSGDLYPVSLPMVLDDEGNAFNPESLAKTYTRDGSGNVTEISVTDGATEWVKTYTRDGSGNVTAESQWVAQ